MGAKLPRRETAKCIQVPYVISVWLSEGGEVQTKETKHHPGNSYLTLAPLLWQEFSYNATWKSAEIKG